MVRGRGGLFAVIWKVVEAVVMIEDVVLEIVVGDVFVRVEKLRHSSLEICM